MSNARIKITLEQAIELFKVLKDETLKEQLINEFGINHFKKLSTNIMERVTTMDDVFDELGINKEEWLKQREFLPKHVVDYEKCSLICQVLNEGWVPDWKKPSQYKFFPYFSMGGASDLGFSFRNCGNQDAYSHIGDRLCLKSSELAVFVGKTFENEYKEWMTI
jgi:hypothetical protein